MAEMTKGKAVELIYGHDTSRILSFLISQPNSAAIRAQLLEELTPELVRMAKTLYSYQFILKLFSYG